MATTTGSRTSAPRMVWIDVAKGIGIFLVVLGHTMAGLINGKVFTSSALDQFAEEWIYSFHMPLFFFVSGLFLPRSAQKPAKSFFADKFKTIVYPYVVWSTISLIIKHLLSRYTNTARGLSEIPKIIYQPVEQFWFLYTLFLLIAAAFLLLRNRLTPRTIVFAAIALHPAIPYILGIPWSFPLEWPPLLKFRENAIYFALGMLVGSSPALRRIAVARTQSLVGMVLTGLAITLLAAFMGVSKEPVLVPFLGLAGTIGVIAASVLATTYHKDRLLQTWGRYSLEIFVAHTIASAGLRIVLSKFLGFNQPLVHLVLGTAIGIYAPLLLAMLCYDRLHFNYAFTFGMRVSPPPDRAAGSDSGRAADSSGARRPQESGRKN